MDWHLQLQVENDFFYKQRRIVKHVLIIIQIGYKNTSVIHLKYQVQLIKRYAANKLLCSVLNQFIAGKLMDRIL